MIEHHDDGPIKVQVVHSPATPADFDAQFAAWARWFAGGEPFAVLTIFRTAAAMRPLPGGVERAAGWLQAHRPQIARFVVAMASVRPGGPPRRQTAPKREPFGVPFAWFQDPLPAMDWLGSALRARAITPPARSVTPWIGGG